MGKIIITANKVLAIFGYKIVRVKPSQENVIKTICQGVQINPSQILNKSEIARRLNVSPAYISMIFSGKRKAPHIREKIVRIIKSELKAA